MHSTVDKVYNDDNDDGVDELQFSKPHQREDDKDEIHVWSVLTI